MYLKPIAFPVSAPIIHIALASMTYSDAYLVLVLANGSMMIAMSNGVLRQITTETQIVRSIVTNHDVILAVLDNGEHVEFLISNETQQCTVQSCVGKVEKMRKICATTFREFEALNEKQQMLVLQKHKWEHLLIGLTSGAVYDFDANARYAIYLTGMFNIMTFNT